MSIIDQPYQDSYPPSLWTGPVVPATGATAGIPGTWTPPGSTAPASVSALQAGTPNVVTASPATAWTSGQFVQTRTTGAAGRATWTGSAWVGGAAPLSTGEPEPEPEPQPGSEPQIEAPEAQAGGGVEYGDSAPAEQAEQPERRRRSRS